MVHHTGPGDEGDDDSAASKGNVTPSEDKYGRINRRSALKLAGAATVGAVFGVGNASAADLSDVEITQADGYEIWTVPEGESVIVDINDGDTIENVLIDQTASGANLYLSAANNPSGWTIRNVGWLGVGYADNISGWGGRFHMTLSGDGLVENVFIDNRTGSDQTPTEIGGGFVPGHHSGTIEVRNTFIAGCGNNAFYASNSGKNNGGEGAVQFFNCYHRDNTVSQFRVGGPGSLIENCVGVVNDPDGTRGLYPNTSSRRARASGAETCPITRSAIRSCTSARTTPTPGRTTWSTVSASRTAPKPSSTLRTGAGTPTRHS